MGTDVGTDVGGDVVGADVVGAEVVGAEVGISVTSTTIVV